MDVLYPAIEQARAWVAVCLGDHGGAAEVLRPLVDRTRRDGYQAHEMFALYDLARLGHAAEVVDRLDELSHVVEGRLAPAMAWHVKTLAGEDGAGLLAAAEELADLDLNLYAAEAAAGAVTLLRAIRSPQTPRASQRLADFRAKCEGPPQTAGAGRAAADADRPGAADRRAGRGRRAEQGDRRPALPVVADGRQPPHAGLREARRQRPGRAGRRPARPAARRVVESGSQRNCQAWRRLAGRVTTSAALLTDHYELTMLSAALRDGTAGRQCVFEVFARRLPTGRRYGVVAGTGRLLERLTTFRFDEDEVAFLRERGSSTTARRTGWRATGSAATSTATPRASCSSPARRS